MYRKFKIQSVIAEIICYRLGENKTIGSKCKITFIYNAYEIAIVNVNMIKRKSKKAKFL